MIKISNRLTNIALFVPKNSNIIDIGCDHALLDIYLIQNKLINSAIVCDINKNALENAKTNIKNNNLINKIKIIQSNGLNNIDTEKIDTIVISGMGAHTMVGILYSNLKKIKNIDTLILQSNNDIDFLRHKIIKIGYYIENETLVKEAGIIYTIIKFKKGYRFYTKKQLYFGPCLLKEKSKIFLEKNKKDLDKFRKIYELIPKKNIHHKFVIRKKIKLLTKLNR